ncbi:MAG: hypothetical protein KIT45_03305 [Fimbriimonadia bacterium]|nr:hypothetical protein [Fimbriimonadia bacterium]
MQFREAQQYVGSNCQVAWKDRHGNVQTNQVFITDVSFVPLYGICLITDLQEIRLDRIVEIHSLEFSEQKAA